MNLHRKTLVLLHGHGIDDTIWDSLDAAINDSYTVVRPNISLLTSCQSVEEYADELHRFLTNANIQKCTLIGHSMGGYISLAFAEKYKDMLEGFGLFHSTAYADDDAKKHQRGQMIDLLRTYGTESFVKSTAANLFGERYKELYPERIKEHIAYFGKLPAEALIAGITAMRNRPDRTAVLSSLPFPVLFIIGMQDKLIPFESVIELAEFPKKSYPLIFAEAGHMGMVERPCVECGRGQVAVFVTARWGRSSLHSVAARRSSESGRFDYELLPSMAKHCRLRIVLPGHPWAAVRQAARPASITKLLPSMAKRCWLRTVLPGHPWAGVRGLSRCR